MDFFPSPLLIEFESGISSEENHLEPQTLIAMTGMKNNRAEKAWRGSVHLRPHMFSSRILIDDIIQERSCFPRERGILQMEAYWNDCQKKGAIIPDSY